MKVVYTEVTEVEVIAVFCFVMVNKYPSNCFMNLFCQMTKTALLSHKWLSTTVTVYANSVKYVMMLQLLLQVRALSGIKSFMVQSFPASLRLGL